MQIQLCEDDGDFYGGVPQLVVVVVKYDDGKTKRIPYPADKPISALYQDLRAIAPQVIDQKVDISPLQQVKMDLMVKTVEGAAVGGMTYSNANKPLSTVKEDNSNTIEKEDLVTLVKLNPRDLHFSGTISPLIVGMDYRVIAIIGPKIPTPDGKGIKQIIQGLEVIDDNAATPERMIVTPDEVVLKRKRTFLGIEKTYAIEEILSCPACSKHNSLKLEGSYFVGTCDECGVDIKIGRIVTNCKNKNCKDQKVSCFDVGGRYEGHCGNCKALIEVPYAN